MDTVVQGAIVRETTGWLPHGRINGVVAIAELDHRLIRFVKVPGDKFLSLGCERWVHHACAYVRVNHYSVPAATDAGRHSVGNSSDTAYARLVSYLSHVEAIGEGESLTIVLCHYPESALATSPAFCFFFRSGPKNFERVTFINF